MKNLYLWFETKEERRAFVVELLEIHTEHQRNGTETLSKEWEESLAELEEGKTFSPYYNLYRRYYFAKVPEEEELKAQPWDGAAVFKQGFRQLYTQKSYCHRPGNWLVIQFRNTKEARRRYWWVLERIPKERMGTNVPLPRSSRAKLEVRWVEEVFAYTEQFTMQLLLEMQNALNYAKEENPKLFRGDKVYLWERMAFEFYNHHHLKKAEECLRTQASFQPTKTDAYLNLGAFLSGYGLEQAAIRAYKEGLAIDPHCEFLNYNLGTLYQAMGRTTQAQEALNEALLANPDRTHNYFAKGEICLEREQHAAAIGYSQKVLDLYTEEEGVSIQITSLRYMGEAYMKLEDFGKAVERLKGVVRLDPDDELSHMSLATCYTKLGDRDRSLWHSKKALQLSRGSANSATFGSRDNVHHLFPEEQPEVKSLVEMKNRILAGRTPEEFDQEIIEMWRQSGYSEERIKELIRYFL